MLDFKVIKDEKTGEKILETSLSGKAILTIPQLNKGTAFSEHERSEFKLRGKLPIRIETLAEQVNRSYLQFQLFETKLQKSIFLNNLHNTNQVLFYALVKDHIVEMFPLIYTPIIGTFVKEYSREFRQARGLYITHSDKNDLDEILNNRSNPEIDIIVVTDGERVLGLGDQGVGAIAIPVSKLIVYSLCGAIDPNRTLPIMLDVGTNNQELLNDPLYLGLRHRRIETAAYDEFIAAFISAVKKKFPHIYLHWEDFGRQNANRNLEKYREEITSFNDDIQGTGVVALAALLSGIKKTQQKMTEQRIVIFGAGSAGTGVAEQICSAIIKAGLSEQEARKCFWLVDAQGLITEDKELTAAQKPFARSLKDVQNWSVNNNNFITLEEVVNHVKPTVLIGTSAVSSAFNKEIVQSMAKFVEHPIILPLSNPTEKSEANPQEVIAWTENKALMATGSPFDDVIFHEQKIPIAQCNNAFAFPGIGLGAISCRAKMVSDDMLLIAAESLSDYAITHVPEESMLLPRLEDVEKVALHIAKAVAHEAVKEKLSSVNEKKIPELIQKHTWEPHYLKYKKV